MYPLYADSIHEQRKYAKEHGGTWKDDGEQQDPLTKRLVPQPKTAARSTWPPPTLNPSP
jgi:hypothetical protein